MDTYTAEREFRAAMIAADLAPQRDDPLRADGRLHRYAAEGDRPHKRNAWYVLYADGDFPAGAFGSWRTGQTVTWSGKSDHEFTDEERAAWRKRMDEIRAQRVEETYRMAERAAKIWAALPDTGTSPYLQRKKVRAFGLRFAKNGTIVVPVRDTADTLWGLQFISADGTKRFLTGTAKKGRYHPIPSAEKTIAICEGYATGASIHMATGWSVAIAFDAGNLRPVAEALVERYPEFQFVVCADDDRETPGNPGRTAGIDAARAIGARVVWPWFAESPS